MIYILHQVCAPDRESNSAYPGPEVRFAAVKACHSKCASGDDTILDDNIIK